MSENTNPQTQVQNSTQKKTYLEELMYINLYSGFKDELTGKEFLVMNKENFERYGFRVEPKLAIDLIVSGEKPVKKILDLGILRVYRMSFISNHDSFHIKDMLLMILESSIDMKHGNTPRKWLIGGVPAEKEFKDEYYASYVLKKIFSTLSETLAKSAILYKFEWDKNNEVLYFGFLIEQQKYEQMYRELKEKGIDDKIDNPNRIKMMHGEFAGDMAFIWLAIDELEFEKLVAEAFHKM